MQYIQEKIAIYMNFTNDVTLWGNSAAALNWFELLENYQMKLHE